MPKLLGDPLHAFTSLFLYVNFSYFYRSNAKERAPFIQLVERSINFQIENEKKRSINSFFRPYSSTIDLS